MKIVGIIPARFDSSRFPGKPLADICGRPMIRHVYERASRSRRLDRLLVATDDGRIMAAVRAFGGESMLTRRNHPSGTDRLAEASRALELADEDIVVNIQGDEPLLDPIMIDILVDALERGSDAPMATLAYLCRNEEGYNNPNVVKVVVDRNYRALYFSRSPLPYRRDPADNPVSFLKHLGFYAYRHAFLQSFTRLPPGCLEELEKLEQLRALEHGHSIRVALSPVESYGVDTPEDLERVVARMQPQKC